MDLLKATKWKKVPADNLKKTSTFSKKMKLKIHKNCGIRYVYRGRTHLILV